MPRVLCRASLATTCVTFRRACIHLWPLWWSTRRAEYLFSVGSDVACLSLTQWFNRGTLALPASLMLFIPSEPPQHLSGLLQSLAHSLPGLETLVYFSPLAHRPAGPSGAFEPLSMLSSLKSLTLTFPRRAVPVQLGTMAHVHAVSVSLDGATADVFSPAVECLSLKSSKLPYGALASLPSLKRLSLVDCSLDWREASKLSGLRLSALELSACPVVVKSFASTLCELHLHGAAHTTHALDSCLSGLPSLTSLYLPNHDFKTPPPSLLFLSRLEVLSLEHCSRLSTLEPLSRLRHLKSLKLDHTTVPTLPASLSALSRLTSISARSSRLSFVAPELASLNVEFLDLSSCQLRELPRGLTCFGRLRELSLTNNPDLRCVSALSCLTELTRLYFKDIAVPDSYCQLLMH